MGIFWLFLVQADPAVWFQIVLSRSLYTWHHLSKVIGWNRPCKMGITPRLGRSFGEIFGETRQRCWGHLRAIWGTDHFGLILWVTEACKYRCRGILACLHVLHTCTVQVIKEHTRLDNLEPSRSKSYMFWFSWCISEQAQKAHPKTINVWTVWRQTTSSNFSSCSATGVKDMGTDAAPTVLLGSKVWSYMAVACYSTGQDVKTLSNQDMHITQNCLITRPLKPFSISMFVASPIFLHNENTKNPQLTYCFPLFGPSWRPC